MFSYYQQIQAVQEHYRVLIYAVLGLNAWFQDFE